MAHGGMCEALTPACVVCVCVCVCARASCAFACVHARACQRAARARGTSTCACSWLCAVWDLASHNDWSSRLLSQVATDETNIILYIFDLA